MKTEFNYSPKKFKTSDFTSVAIALALIVVPIFMPFSIGFRRLVLVPYPFSMYLLVAIGIALLAYQFKRLSNETKLRKEARPIVVDGDKVSFVKLGKNGVQQQEILLSEVSKVDYDSEDMILKVTTPAGEFKFDSDYFDNVARFDEFRALFNQE